MKLMKNYNGLMYTSIPNLNYHSDHSIALRNLLVLSPYLAYFSLRMLPLLDPICRMNEMTDV